jgi:hypothetical protein
MGGQPAEIIMGRITNELLGMVKVRDNGRCRACGIGDFDALQADHIVPASLGGEDRLDNLQTLCFVCNVRKGNVNVGELPILPPVEGFGDFREVMVRRQNFVELVKSKRASSIQSAILEAKRMRADGVAGFKIRRAMAKMVDSRHIERILMESR